MKNRLTNPPYGVADEFETACFVELLGGLLFLAAYLRLSGPEGAIDPYAIPQLLVWWVWIALMIAGSFIDFDHQVLPDFATQGGMVLGFAHAGAELFRRSAAGEQAAAAAGDAPFWFLSGPFADAVAGLAVGFGLMWLVRKAGTAAFKREAMGEGDVWLMGAVGAMFGPVAAVATLVVSSLIGSVAGLGLVLLGRTKLGRFAEIPFGPYICMACLAWMFRGPELWRWYRGLVLGMMENIGCRSILLRSILKFQTFIRMVHGMIVKESSERVSKL